MRYYNGEPPEIMRFGTVFPGANIQLIDKTTEVAPGITLIALVSDAQGTKELKELSLAIDTPDGIVLVVGCSHPGIESIVAEAAKINPHIHFIAGGLHLGTTLGVGASPRAESNRSAAFSEEDSRSYRTLLASSDDSKEGARGSRDFRGNGYSLRFLVYAVTH
jgi:hypothetical protein